MHFPGLESHGIKVMFSRLVTADASKQGQCKIETNN